MSRRPSGLRGTVDSVQTAEGTVERRCRRPGGRREAVVVGPGLLVHAGDHPFDGSFQSSSSTRASALEQFCPEGLQPSHRRSEGIVLPTRSHASGVQDLGNHEVVTRPNPMGSRSPSRHSRGVVHAASIEAGQPAPTSTRERAARHWVRNSRSAHDLRTAANTRRSRRASAWKRRPRRENAAPLAMPALPPDDLGRAVHHRVSFRGNVESAVVRICLHLRPIACFDAEFGGRRARSGLGG